MSAKLRFAVARHLNGIHRLSESFAENQAMALAQVFARDKSRGSGVTFLHYLTLTHWPLACVWEDDGDVLGFLALGNASVERLESAVLGSFGRLEPEESATFLSEFVALAFSVHPINRLVYLAESPDSLMAGACKSAGFQDEGSLRQYRADGTCLNFLQLSLLRADIGC